MISVLVINDNALWTNDFIECFVLRLVAKMSADITFEKNLRTRGRVEIFRRL
jgi:hypothetical protein